MVLCSHVRFLPSPHWYATVIFKESSTEWMRRSSWKIQSYLQELAPPTYAWSSSFSGFKRRKASRITKSHTTLLSHSLCSKLSLCKETSTSVAVRWTRRSAQGSVDPPRLQPHTTSFTQNQYFVKRPSNHAPPENLSGRLQILRKAKIGNTGHRLQQSVFQMSVDILRLRRTLLLRWYVLWYIDSRSAFLP